jgi:hypothetical protein
LLAFEQLLQLVRVYTWNRDVRTHTVNDQSEQQKHQSATKITELACFCYLSRAGCHE